jgi:elongation factor P--beta-lysine ligase
MDIKTNVENLNGYKKYLLVEEAVNEFLKSNGYLKLDLPVLSPSLIPESYLEVFETEFKYMDKSKKLYLTPSPELFLKRVLAYGVGDCYYLGKCFRNSDPSATLHSFEFQMLEFYKMGADYMDIADVVLAMLRYINTKVKNKKLNFDRWEKRERCNSKK